MTESVKLGSIGLGWWGGELARAALASGQAEIVSCFARTEQARVDFGREWGAEPFESLEEMLADDGLEGVLIATPHSTHLDIITAAAEAGKHVFVEKPLTLSVAEGRQAVEVTEQAGVTLQVGHHRRRQPATRKLHKLIDAGELGQVSLLESNLSGKSGLNPRTGWRGDRDECPLGAMTGMGVHMADNLIYLAGRPMTVTTLSKKTLARGPLDDVTVIGVELESGALGYLGSSHVIPKTCMTAAYGSEGTAWSEEEGTRLFRQRIDEQSRSEIDVSGADALPDQLAEFASCIRTGATPEVDGRQALEVVALLEAAVLAQERRATVDVAELRP